MIVDFTPGRPHAERGRGQGKQDRGRPRSRWIKRLGELDQLVEWFRPMDVPSWLSAADVAALPQTMQIRELRYNVARPGFRVREVTLVTTLLDPAAYPKAKVAEAYGLRWTIETHLGQLKTTMKMDVLRCQTVRGIEKELTMFLLVYNLVRMTILKAAKQQGVLPDRISFIDALRWLATARPGEALPELVVNPSRPGRYEPRVRKRRPKEYGLMVKPRDELRKILLEESLKA